MEIKPTAIVFHCDSSPLRHGLIKHEILWFQFFYVGKRRTELFFSTKEKNYFSVIVITNFILFNLKLIHVQLSKILNTQYEVSQLQ